MTDIPISRLPNAAAIQGPELIPVVQAGTTVQTTAQNVLEGLSVVSGINISNQTVLANGATTARTLAAMAGDVENFYSHGGIDGASDNKAAIDATLAASKLSGRSAWFPSGTINTSGNHVVLAGSAPIQAKGTYFQSTGNANADCFVFSQGNHTYGHEFGGFGDFSNRAVAIVDASLCGVTIGAIPSGNIGVSVETSAGASLINTVTFGSISGCTTAILRRGTNSGATMQGNVFKGNFITGCVNAILYDLPPNDNNCSLEYYEIYSIDGTGATSSNGIVTASGSGGFNQTTFNFHGFFGGFSGYLCNFYCNNNRIIFSIQGNYTYAQMQANGEGNFIRNLYQYNNQQYPTAANTSPNSRASFNSGNPYPSNNIPLSFQVPALTAGQIVDFYVYHPFTNGFVNFFSLRPRFSQPIAVQCIEDTSVIAGIDGQSAPNQIHIRLVALATLTASTQNADLVYCD